MPLELPGQAVAGPLWDDSRGRFLVVTLSGDELQLLSFASDGQRNGTTSIPLSCNGQKPELSANKNLTVVSCGELSWAASESDSWTWWWSEASGGPTVACGAAHAVRRVEKGLEIHFLSGGTTKQVPLQMGSGNEGLEIACSALESIAYVPTRGGDALEAVDLASESVVATLQEPQLGGRMAAVALGPEKSLWILHTDGAVSAWELGPTHLPSLRWRVSGFGRPAPVPGTFAATAEMAWYVGADGKLVVSSDATGAPSLEAPGSGALGFVPLLGDDRVFLAMAEAADGAGASVSLWMQFDTGTPVWLGEEQRQERSVALKCQELQWSAATVDGVLAIRCDGDVKRVATPSPGVSFVVQSGGGGRWEVGQ